MQDLILKRICGLSFTDDGQRIPRFEVGCLFGPDVPGYDSISPEYPTAVYERLQELCGLASGTRTLEIGVSSSLVTRIPSWVVCADQVQRWRRLCLPDSGPQFWISIPVRDESRDGKHGITPRTRVVCANSWRDEFSSRYCWIRCPRSQ